MKTKNMKTKNTSRLVVLLTTFAFATQTTLAYSAEAQAQRILRKAQELDRAALAEEISPLTKDFKVYLVEGAKKTRNEVSTEELLRSTTGGAERTILLVSKKEVIPGHALGISMSTTVSAKNQLGLLLNATLESKDSELLATRSIEFDAEKATTDEGAAKIRKELQQTFQLFEAEVADELKLQGKNTKDQSIGRSVAKILGNFFPSAHAREPDEDRATSSTRGGLSESYVPAFKLVTLMVGVVGGLSSILMVLIGSIKLTSNISNDPRQRTTGVLLVAGGLVIGFLSLNGVLRAGELKRPK